MIETRDTSTIAHPAPARGRVAWWIVLAGLVVAPAAWFLQLNSSFVLGAAGCPGFGPSTSFVQLFLVVIGVLAVLLALAALGSAVRAWTKTSREGPGDHHAALTGGHGRTRFLGLAGIIVSCIFLAAVCFALLVPWLVPACGV